MESDSFKLIVIVFCVVMSAYFSATETAFSMINRIRIKNMAENGNFRAALVYRMSENYDKLLSTILIGNNIVNIASASLATVLFVKHFGDIGATMSTAVTTIVVLIFGEISPKSLAKESPESFAMFSAPILNVMQVALTPINFLFVQWKRLLSTIFKSDSNRSMTDEELITLVEEAEQEGGIDEQESELIRNAIEFNEMLAEDILTPRVDITAIPETCSKEDVKKIFEESGYSRLPVYRKTIDNIVGVIHQKDFYSLQNAKISEITKVPVYTAPTMRVGALLKILQQKKSHIAVVTDEFGGTMGIVTMEDILEELVGEIWDEHDEVVVEFQEIAAGRYKILCSASIDELEDYLDLKIDTDTATVSGWVIEMLEKIPEEGDSFDYKNFNIAVSKTDGRRLIEIIVTALNNTENTNISADTKII